MASPPQRWETPVSSNKPFSNDVSANEFVTELKKTTPCRMGIGHCGARYPTKAQLKFREDLAISNDVIQRDTLCRFDCLHWLACGDTAKQGEPVGTFFATTSPAS